MQIIEFKKLWENEVRREHTPHGLEITSLIACNIKFDDKVQLPGVELRYKHYDIDVLAVNYRILGNPDEDVVNIFDVFILEEGCLIGDMPHMVALWLGGIIEDHLKNKDVIGRRPWWEDPNATRSLECFW